LTARNLVDGGEVSATAKGTIVLLTLFRDDWYQKP
jgi:hypothetical protein